MGFIMMFDIILMAFLPILIFIAIVLIAGLILSVVLFLIGLKRPKGKRKYFFIPAIVIFTAPILLFTGISIYGFFTSSPKSNEPYVNPAGTIANELSQEVIDGFIARDEEAVLSFFDFKSQKSPTIEKQIQEAFYFIDGNIISYELPQNTGWSGLGGGIANYAPVIKNVITDTGKKYEIKLQYYLDAKIYERVRSSYIYVYSDKNNEGNNGFRDWTAIAYEYSDDLESYPYNRERVYMREFFGVFNPQKSEKLKNMFCSIIADSTNLDEEITKLFDFMGNISFSRHTTDFTFWSGDLDGKYVYIDYSYFAKVRDIRTSNGTFTLKVYFELLNTKENDNENKVGISELRLMHNDTKEEFIIGDYYSVHPDR